MKKIVLPFLLIGLLGFSFQSCEKKNPGLDGEEPSADEWIVMDQTYNHFTQLSLWIKETGITMPRTNADLRNFTKNYKDADEVLEALIEKTPKIGPNGTPVDRYSFIDRAGQVGEEIGEGIHRNIGLSLQYMLMSQNSDEVGLFIRLVQKNSPSETAGLTRGLQIIKVDGETLRLTADDSGRVNGNTNVANKLFTGDVNTLEVKKYGESSTQTVNIPTSGNGWKIDPIVHKGTFQLPNNKKVGYFAYSSFVSVIDVKTDGQGNVISADPNSYYEDLATLFDGFVSEGIDELIIDLRYNGGGATNAAELLTNLIVPSGNNDQIMYKHVVNELLESEGFLDPEDTEAPFKPVHINKTGNLNLSRAYFLVTTASASASEMVINNLKPYMDVQIISVNNRGTYGKPVGSFGARIHKDNSKVLATTYITSFKTVNKDGGGDYYAGLIGEKRDSRDYLDYELGDPEEAMLSDALYHIETNGSYRSASARASIARGNRSIFVPQAIDFHVDKSVQGLYNLDHSPTININ